MGSPVDPGDTEKRGGKLFTKNTAFSQHVNGSIRSESCPMEQVESKWLTLNV